MIFTNFFTIHTFFYFFYFINMNFQSCHRMCEKIYSKNGKIVNSCKGVQTQKEIKFCPDESDRGGFPPATPVGLIRAFLWVI